MNRRLALGTGLTAMLLASVAGAQEVTIGYQGLPYKASGESNTGIQVSEGILLHVGAGAEAGYDTNVFYQPSGQQISSPIIRTSLFAEMANATRSGAVGKLAFDIRAGLTYRYYQSSDLMVEPFKNAWMPTAGVSLNTGSGQFAFGFADTFARLEDPPYSPTSTVIIRDNNQASAEARWSPGGGRLTTTLRYTNMVDVFENNGPGSYAYATTDSNYLMLDGSWKWLPKTAVFVNVVQGYVFYLNQALATANNKASSFPLTVSTGLRGLLTEKTAASVALGYTNGFYSNGASSGGFWGSTYADANVTVRPSMLSRVVLGYRHDFTNAVIASLSQNEHAYASYVQQIAGRLALDLSGRYQYAAYGGAFVDPNQVGRIDNIFQVGATLDYFLRNWVYAGLGYSLLTDSSNKPGLGYVKQQTFVRLGLTY